MFNHRFEEKDKILTIIIEGAFDTGAAQKVQAELETYKEKDISQVIFDLSKATLMASSGLRVIFYARDKLKKGMKVQLKGATGLVAKVIKMSGIKKFVEII